jgi:hypothetical protein
MTIQKYLVLVPLIIFGTCCLAISQGAVNAFVPDADTRCINGNRDYIWIKMLDLKASKEKGFLTQNSSLGVLINTTALGATGGGKQNDNEKIAFPSMAQADVKHDAKGALILPLQLGLVTQLALNKTQDTRFAELDFEVKLLQKKDKTPWGSAISTLLSMANDLPLPPSPYTTGARYFSKYANAAISKSLETEKPEQQDLKGRTVLQFKPVGHKIAAGEKCAGWAQTGSYLIVDGAGPGETEDQGFVDIGRLNDYCWLGEFDAGLSVKWTKKLAVGCDKDGWKSLRNAYIPMVVQAIDNDDMTQAGKSLSAGERFNPSSFDVKNAVRRCGRYGIANDEKDCLPELTAK